MQAIGVHHGVDSDGVALLVALSRMSLGATWPYVSTVLSRCLASTIAATYRESLLQTGQIQRVYP
jgi:hypothetical protein